MPDAPHESMPRLELPPPASDTECKCACCSRQITRDIQPAPRVTPQLPAAPPGSAPMATPLPPPMPMLPMPMSLPLPLPMGPPVKPCRFFNGPHGCLSGQACPYLHVPLRCAFFETREGCKYAHGSCSYLHVPASTGILTPAQFFGKPAAKPRKCKHDHCPNLCLGRECRKCYLDNKNKKKAQTVGIGKSAPSGSETQKEGDWHTQNNPGQR